ncbi:MAG: HD domain-containing protein [Candidatus Falkowbacteria bacterium]
MIYTPKIQRAIKFAAKTHNHYQQQTRKGKLIPYIAHPLTVGIILALSGASEDVVVAGILHDTIEDSVSAKKVSFEMLAERFGDNVAQLVLSVTEQDKDLNWEERKKLALDHISHFSNEALLVKSADVVSNMSELVDDYARYGDEIFARFNAPKEKIIENQLKVISAIINVWSDNPLKDDLLLLLNNLGDLNK